MAAAKRGTDELEALPARADTAGSLLASSLVSFTTRAFWEPVRVRKVRFPDGTFSPEEPLHEDWLELFTDLLFVAFYMKMSGGLGAAGWAGGASVLFAFVMFWNAITANMSMTQWINMNAGGGLLRLLVLGMIPLGFCICQTFSDPGRFVEDAVGYNLGFTLIRVGLSLLLFKGWFWNQDLGTFPLICAGGHLLAAATVLVGMSISRESWAMLAAHSLAGLVELASRLVILPCSPLWKAPPRFPGINIAHVQGRLGIAVMVALGESIIQILTVESEVGDFWRNAITLGGFCLAFNFALIYFDAVPHDINDHVLRKSWSRATIWRYSFPFLIFAVFYVGFCFEVILVTAQQEEAGHSSHEVHELLGVPAEVLFGYAAESLSLGRRLSGGHLHHEWTLDRGLSQFSAAVGVAHMMLTVAQFVHDGLEGLKPTRMKVRLAVHLALAACHLSVTTFSRTLHWEPDNRALFDVLLHWALTIPLVLSTLKSQSHQEHHGGHGDHGDHGHGEGHGHEPPPAAAAAAADADEPEAEGPAPGQSFGGSMHSQGSRRNSCPMPAGDYTCDPFCCKTEGGVPQVGLEAPDADFAGSQLRSFNPESAPPPSDAAAAAPASL